MTTPQMIVHDVLTGETYTRDFTAAEIAQAKADDLAEKIAADKAAADATARATTRQTLLDKLGITTDEVKLLLG
jgi:hypothetical protein